MIPYIIAGAVIALMGLLAGWGETLQIRWEDRRLSRHTCHVACIESRWCRCGCRDGLFGIYAESRCAVCGTQFVDDPEGFDGPYSSGQVFIWGKLPGETEVTEDQSEAGRE